jgi:hypothetical protein
MSRRTRELGCLVRYELDSCPSQVALQGLHFRGWRPIRPACCGRSWKFSADSSQVTAERGETEALGMTLTANLVDVEHALEKIEAGTYGTCEACHDEIVAARLEAMPAARFCITCAAKRR